MTKFNWNVDESVVVPSQSAIAVYGNDSGNCVILKQAEWNDDDDIAIIVNRKNVLLLIAGLQRFLSEGGNGEN